MPESNEFDDDSAYIEVGLTGNRFYIHKADTYAYDIREIAFALSNQARYTGHVRGYCVAEHCIHVSELVPRQYAMEGLLHDMAEFAMGDLAAPWKHLFQEWRPLEEKIHAAMARHFQVPEHVSPMVKLADWRMLFIEAHAMLPTQGKEWIGYEEHGQGIPRTGEPRIRKWSAEKAEHRFLERYYELGGK